MEIVLPYLTWKVGFFFLLGLVTIVHLASSLAILQLVAAIEGKEGKTIPKSNKWKLVTILPFAALYYSVKAVFIKERTKDD